MAMANIVSPQFDDLHVSDTISSGGDSTTVPNCGPIQFPVPMVPDVQPRPATRPRSPPDSPLIADEDQLLHPSRQTHELVIGHERPSSGRHPATAQEQHKVEMNTHFVHLKPITGEAEAEDHRHKTDRRPRPVRRGALKCAQAARDSTSSTRSKSTIPNQFIGGRKGIREQLVKG